MAYSDEKREEALSLLTADLPGGKALSINAVARQMGLSPATVKKWATDAALVVTTDAKPPADARAVAEWLLRKARAVGAGIEKLDSKAAMETATAVEKLLNAYLKLENGSEGPDPQQAVQVNVVLESLLRRD